MKNLLFVVFLVAPLFAEVIASERVIDGLCELYNEKHRARNYDGYSAQRSLNKRIEDYKARFGLKDFDESECGFDDYQYDYGGGYNRNYGRGYMDGYHDRGYDRRPGRKNNYPNPQDPWD